MTPEQMLDLVELALANHRRDLALAVVGQVATPEATMTAAVESEASANAARCRRYRARRARRDDMPTMSEGMSPDMVASMSEPMSPHVTQRETGMSLTHVAPMSLPMSLPMSQEGERGRGDYRGVVGEGEIGVLANSGNTGNMLPMVSMPPKSTALTRPSTIDAVKGKLVHMAEVRERRESKHKGEAELVFRYWQAKLGHTKALFSRDREAKLVARLREGATPDELCYAVDGIAKSKFHMGDNDSGTRYDGVEFLFRNRANVEKFAGSQRGFRDGTAHPFVAEALSAMQQTVQQAAGATIAPALGVAYA